MHVAAQLGRPVLLIHGDDEFGSSDLVGGQLGFRSSRVVDNFIHSVVKTEENFTKTWVDHRLTSACKYGFTVIYDEFNRSRPEANNVLLSILEERLLELPVSRMNEGYLAVHPDFCDDLHEQSRGIRGRPQDPGRPDGPDDHDHRRPLRP